MTVSQRVHAQVALVVFLVAGLAATDWLLVPAKANAAIIAIATMAGIWLFVAVVGRVRPFDEQSASERSFLVASVMAAGLIIVVSLGKGFFTGLGFGGEMLDRGVGVASGAVLLALGNTLPKILGSLTARRCSPAQIGSTKRLAGWAFALAGLANIAAWSLLPVAQAGSLADVATMTAMAIVVLRCAWAFLAPRVPRATTTEG